MTTKCKHDNAVVYEPGEITIDAKGHARDDGLRVFCPDCNDVRTFDATDPMWLDFHGGGHSRRNASRQ